MPKQGVRVNAAAWQPTTQATSQSIFTTRPFPEMSQQEQETAGKGEKTAPTVRRPGMIENINRSMATNPIAASNLGITGVQAKLTIGEPGDQYEQEADKVAAEVVQKMNAPEVPPITAPPRGDGVDKSIQRKPLIPIIASVPAPREDIYRKGQLKAPNVPDLQADFEKQLNQARGGGRPLDAAFRAKIESAMGTDFSGVRVHTDSRADQMSQSIQAKAFTTGQDVFFRQGAYDPGSRGGQELLAHELTHVVQQNGETVQRSPTKRVAANGQSTVVQRVAMNFAITGITHLVKKKGKSIFQGDEFREVEEGDIIRIDTDVRLRSRRGPNQEEFREEDRKGEHIYHWYKVLSVNGQDVGADVFVREDTIRDLSNEEQLNHTPATITGAMSNVSASASEVNKAISEYLKTGADVTAALNQLEKLTNPAEMIKVVKEPSEEVVTNASADLGKLFPDLRKFAEFLEPLGDGAREPALLFLNQLQTLLENLAKGLPPKKFVEILTKLPEKALKLLGKTTEMGMTPMEEQERPALPEVGESMEQITARYDVISRKVSASTRRKGAIHEVDLAMMPRTRGLADIKALIEPDGRVIIEPGQAERAFAIGYVGAINFAGELSNQGGERYYGTLFPKGWLAHFAQDVRIEGGGSAREPSAEEFAAQKFTDKNREIVIEEGKAFLIRAEESTSEEGQVTVHMDRNQLLFGGKPMMQFIREATLGVVEFNKDGIVLHLRMF